MVREYSDNSNWVLLCGNALRDHSGNVPRQVLEFDARMRKATKNTKSRQVDNERRPDIGHIYICIDLAKNTMKQVNNWSRVNVIVTSKKANPDTFLFFTNRIPIMNPLFILTQYFFYDKV